MHTKGKRWIYQSPKTALSKRTITLDKKKTAILKEWQIYQRKFLFQRGYNTNNDNQIVFTSDTNNHIDYNVIRNAIKRIIKRHNLPYINIHGFRHTHCALLFSAGVEMHKVKERLGHASITTTMDIYNHVSKEDSSEIADILGDFMSL